MYAIAKYLTLEARREAVRHTYRRHGSDLPGDCRMIGCDRAGRDPLGVVLYSLGYAAPTVPDADVVARAMTVQTQEVWHYHAILRAATRFIDDWDDGKITDLADALGVKEEGDE